MVDIDRESEYGLSYPDIGTPSADAHTTLSENHLLLSDALTAALVACDDPDATEVVKRVRHDLEWLAEHHDSVVSTIDTLEAGDE